MSKVDAQRAMREAKYAANQAAAARRAPTARSDAAPPERPAARRAPVADVVVPGAVAVEPAAPEADRIDAEPEVCGHRNMGGKTCRRPAGHTEKNHRYS